MKFLRSLKLASALLALAGLALPTSTWAAKVELVREGDAWSLRRDGQPFGVEMARKFQKRAIFFGVAIIRP